MARPNGSTRAGSVRRAWRSNSRSSMSASSQRSAASLSAVDRAAARAARTGICGIVAVSASRRWGLLPDIGQSVQCSAGRSALGRAGDVRRRTAAIATARDNWSPMPPVPRRRWRRQRRRKQAEGRRGCRVGPPGRAAAVAGFCRFLGRRFLAGGAAGAGTSST